MTADQDADFLASLQAAFDDDGNDLVDHALFADRVDEEFEQVKGFVQCFFVFLLSETFGSM